jgi:hypothetical protein
MKNLFFDKEKGAFFFIECLTKNSSILSDYLCSKKKSMHIYSLQEKTNLHFKLKKRLQHEESLVQFYCFPPEEENHKKRLESSVLELREDLKKLGVELDQAYPNWKTFLEIKIFFRKKVQ